MPRKTSARRRAAPEDAAARNAIPAPDAQLDIDVEDDCACKVDNFVVSPTSTVDRVVDPDTGAVSIMKVCFFVAYFRDDGCCDCCEFRQYVYASTVRINDVPIAAIGGVLLDGAGNYEDVDAAGRAYGHRADPGEDGDRYVADQAGGCIYVGRDYPGLHDAPPGTSYDIDLHFMDVVIDTCNDDAVVAGPQFWDLVTAGVA